MKNKIVRRFISVVMSLVLMITLTNIYPFKEVIAYDYLSRGIDVSDARGMIDWDKVRDSGIYFAIIRAGYGNANAYPWQKDKYFDYNISNAQRVGIKCGVYWFCYATSVEAAYEEADSCYEIIKDIKLDYPVYVDIEDEKNHVLINAFGKNKDKITEMTLAFCNRLSSYGVRVGVYANKNWFTNYIDKNQIIDNGYEIWLAMYPSGEYAVNPDDYDKSSECGIWQYSSKGSVDGIDGNVDVDVSYKDFGEDLPSDITILGQTEPSGILEEGHFFGVYGNIRSNRPIQEVWGGVYYRDGEATDQWFSASPDTTTYSLYPPFDDRIIFNNLPVGYYTYKIFAKDDQQEYTLINSDFQIGYPEPLVQNYTVWLNASGGDVSLESITVQTDGAYNELPTPSRYGYDFAGWFDDSGRQVWDGVGIYTNGEHTLYAHWTPKTVTVNLNANGGTVSTDTIQVNFDSNYNNLPNPVKDGYNFAGWFTSVEGGSQIDINSVCNTTDEHTLYAHWTKDDYIITFNAMGGNIKVTSKRVIYGSKYGVLPVPEEKNAKFVGWFTDDGVQVTSSSIVTGSAELYAKWKVIGDINADEKLTIADAVLLQKYLLAQIKFSEDEFYAGDINSDGSVDVFDMVFMRKILTEE